TMAQASSGGGGRPPGTGTGSGGGKNKPPAAASPPRDRVTERSGNPPTGDDTVEVAKSPGDGSVASHKPDVPVSEKTKDGQKVTTTRDDRPANPQVHAPGDRQAHNSGDQQTPPRGDGQASPQLASVDARPPASDNGTAGPTRPAPRPVSGSGGTSSPPPPGETAVLGGAAPGMMNGGGGVQVETPSSTTRPKKQSGSARGPRQAHLVLRRIEPWSAMKFSFVLSLVSFVILFVAVAVLYSVLSGLGVFESIVSTINSITNADAGSPGAIDASSWFDPVRILGFTALIGAIDVVLITALSTLGAVIYNLASSVA